MCLRKIAKGKVVNECKEVLIYEIEVGIFWVFLISRDGLKMEPKKVQVIIY